MMSDCKTMSREEFNAKWPEEKPDGWHSQAAWDIHRAAALAAWEKQQPQPLTGGDAGFWERLKCLPPTYRHRGYQWNEASGIISLDGVETCAASSKDRAKEIIEAHKAMKAAAEVAAYRISKAQMDAIEEFPLELGGEAHKAAEETHEPEAGFWVAQSSGWRRGEYTLAAFDMVVRLRSDIIGKVKTKEEAQRLVEQHMAKRGLVLAETDLSLTEIIETVGREELQAELAKRTEEQSPAKAARPQVEHHLAHEMDGLAYRQGRSDKNIGEQLDRIVSLEVDLAEAKDRQDDDAARIDELEKRVGELANKVHKNEGTMNWHMEGVRREALEAKAKDPELPRNPRGLEKVVEVLRERGRHYKPEGGPWTPEQFSAFGAMMEAASIVEKALAQPQPASEPCGVDWEELAESLKQWIWKEHGHANSNFKALDLVEIVKAHLAESGEVR